LPLPLPLFLPLPFVFAIAFVLPLPLFFGCHPSPQAEDLRFIHSATPP
jgi:hypothetical protein